MARILLNFLLLPPTRHVVASRLLAGMISSTNAH
jgi:hypothetical protein